MLDPADHLAIVRRVLKGLGLPTTGSHKVCFKRMCDYYDNKLATPPNAVAAANSTPPKKSPKKPPLAPADLDAIEKYGGRACMTYAFVRWVKPPPMWKALIKTKPDGDEFEVIIRDNETLQSFRQKLGSRNRNEKKLQAKLEAAAATGKEIDDALEDASKAIEKAKASRKRQAGELTLPPTEPQRMKKAKPKRIKGKTIKKKKKMRENWGKPKTPPPSSDDDNDEEEDESDEESDAEPQVSRVSVYDGGGSAGSHFEYAPAEAHPLYYDLNPLLVPSDRKRAAKVTAQAEIQRCVAAESEVVEESEDDEAMHLSGDGGVSGGDDGADDEGDMDDRASMGSDHSTEPDELCIMCGTSVSGEEANIRCDNDNCNRLYHIRCLQENEREAAKAAAADEAAPWTCPGGCP